ncbi:MAG: alpha/beta hydrolase [Labilithrix sp.]|nr:alpha/beta hydrolase [Labilithrix sp.]MCW5809690.1 alpha/beta hydrolase [Labilithrix sp.]
MITNVRRRVGAAVVDGFFNGAARLAKLHPKSKPSHHGVEHVADVAYVPGSSAREHLLDVWRPLPDRQGEGPWPIVFYVHGGGFRILSKDTHWVMGLGFARRGFIVFSISYRLAPSHRFPAAIDDVCAAFAWMTANAARYGGDTSRVVLAGESAGANLVTSLAIALAYEREEPFARRAFATGVVPRAVVPACGVFQVSDLQRLKRRKPKMSPFIADRLHEVEQAYLGPGPWPHGLDLADPVVFFERGEEPARPIPPFFLPVGTKDPLLPDTRRLSEALDVLGVPNETRYYPGELHAFHAFVMRESARQCWRDTFSFLDRYVSPSPSPKGSSADPTPSGAGTSPR